MQPGTLPRRSTSRPLYMEYMLLVAAFFFSFFYMVSASVILPQLGQEWGLSPSSVGFVSSLYFYAYALSQPIGGLLNDTFGPMLVAAVGLGVAALGALSLGMAQSVIGLAAGRMLTGIGLTSILSGTVAFQAAAFPPDRYAFFSGVTYFVGNLGAVVSVAPLGSALERWGRSSVFAGLVVLTLALGAALMARRGRDPVVARRRTDASRGAERVPMNAASVFRQLASAIRLVATTPQLAAIVVLWMVSYGALMTVQGLWGVQWCQATYHTSATSARLWATMVSVGVMAGNVTGSLVAAPASRRRQAIVTSSLTCAAAWAMLWTGMLLRLPIWLTGLGCFLVGASSGTCFVHLTAGVNNLAPAGKGGAVFGAINMMPSLGVIVGQWGTGIVLDAGVGADGAYTHASFALAFGAVLAVVLASQLALARIKGFDAPSHGR